jgi:sugar lactone lactonase YvrE
VRAPILAVCGLLAPFVLACGAPQRAEAPAAAPAPAATTPPPAPRSADYAVPGEAPCVPVDNLKFVCGMVSPEDIAVLPGGEWAIASGNRQGGRLHLVDVKAKSATAVFPAPGQREQLDAARYPTCPGPLMLEKPDLFTAHGLYLNPGSNGRHALYVVHHGTRESIEVFDVDARATPPSLTWVGCAPALSTQTFNAVAALPEGGFAATNTRAGDVWEYHKESGWRPVPGTDKTAPNGLEISKDGRWLYIAGWAEEKVTRVSRGRSPIQKDVINLGFRPDNVRFSADKSALYAAGHTDKNGNSIVEPREILTETINVARIDPTTLEFRRIFVHKAIAGFVAATTAVPIGDELWLGSNRGDRIAYFPAPK